MVAPYAGTTPIPAERAGTAILIPVTNPLERLNKEVKRRADVVGIFPNEENSLVPAGPGGRDPHRRLAEQHRVTEMDDLRDTSPGTARGLTPTVEPAPAFALSRACPRRKRDRCAPAPPVLL